MPETTTGVKALLSNSWAYDAAQVLMGSKRARRLEAERYIRARPGDRVLDLGCGTAEVLDYLPPDVAYTGYDVSEAYIDAAAERYPAQRFNLGALPASEHGYDIVIALGVLHHLSVEECRALLDAALAAVRPGGRVLTIDPVRTGNVLEGVLLALDRGQNIQDADGYARLAYGMPVRLTVVRDLLPLWVPYAHVVMEIG